MATGKPSNTTLHFVLSCTFCISVLQIQSHHKSVIFLRWLYSTVMNFFKLCRKFHLVLLITFQQWKNGVTIFFYLWRHNNDHILFSNNRCFMSQQRRLSALLSLFFSWLLRVCLGAGRAGWWDHSPSSYVAWVRCLDLVSHFGLSLLILC